MPAAAGKRSEYTHTHCTLLHHPPKLTRLPNVTLQAVDLAGNCITDSSSIIALTHCLQLRFLDIRSNDMSAVHIQKVRDAFAGRPGFTLRS